MGETTELRLKNTPHISVTQLLPLSTQEWVHCTIQQASLSWDRNLTLWSLLLSYGYSYKASCARPG